MRNLFLNLMILSMLSLVACNSNSQNRNQRITPEDMAKKQTDWMVELLSLDDEAAEKVGDINLKYVKLMGEARKENRESRDSMRAKMKELNDKKNDELKEVLSEEQFETYTKALKERMEQRGNRQGGDREGRPGGDGQRGGGQRGGE